VGCIDADLTELVRSLATQGEQLDLLGDELIREVECLVPVEGVAFEGGGVVVELGADDFFEGLEVGLHRLLLSEVDLLGKDDVRACGCGCGVHSVLAPAFPFEE